MCSIFNIKKYILENSTHLDQWNKLLVNDDFRWWITIALCAIKLPYIFEKHINQWSRNAKHCAFFEERTTNIMYRTKQNQLYHVYSNKPKLKTWIQFSLKERPGSMSYIISFNSRNALKQPWKCTELSLKTDKT